MKWTRKLGEIFIEIAIIVFAITLSLVLERWRQKQDDRATERKFLSGLQIDLNNDVQEINKMSGLCVSMKAASRFFLQPQQRINWSADSVETLGYHLFHNVYFFPNLNRFESLKSSGKLDVIEDDRLKNEIIDLYQTKIPDLDQQIKFFNDFMNTQVKVYLINNLRRDIRNKPLLDRQFFDQTQTKNILSFYSDLDDIGKRADSCLAVSKRILQLTTSQLKD